MTFRRTGEAEASTSEYADDRLQELMDRANQAFGDPTKILGGPSMTPPKNNGSETILTPPMKKSGKRRGR